MGYGLTQTTTPAAVLTTAEAKHHLRETLVNVANDTYIDDLVAEATKHVEDETNRQLVTATWKLYLDRFPIREGVLCLPRAPLRSVGSIAYVDTAGDTQTWPSAEYRVATTREPGEVTLAFGYPWPSTQAISDAVIVTFDAGYGTAAAVDRRATQAVRQIVAANYAQRGDDARQTMAGKLEIPLAAQRLITQLRCGDAFTRYCA